VSEIVEEAIAAEIAALERVVDVPVPPFGFGTDLSCTTDLTPTMEETSGDLRLALAEALVRRLDCPRGALPDDAAYGKDLRSYLNRPTTALELLELAGAVRAELEKDDRVDTAPTTITTVNAGQTMTLKVVVTPVDPSVGTFAMTLAVTSAEIVLEEISGR
jgi:hypothetical protein